MNVEDFLARLDGVRKAGRGWRARCPGPVHRRGDKNPTLKIDLGRDGRILPHCFAGDTEEEILRAMGITRRDLYPVPIYATGGRAPDLSRSLRSELYAARRESLRNAQRSQAYAEVYADADFVREARRLVDEARSVANRLGDCDRAWDLLADAAALDLEVRIVEARLDGLA